MKFEHAEWTRVTKSLVARNAGWMFVGQGTGAVLQAACFIVLARLLGAAEYGVFIGAFAYTGLVAQYSSLGSGTLLLRYVSEDRKTFPVYWGNVLVSTAVTGAILIAVLCCLAPHLLNARSASLVFLAGISNCVFATLTEQTGRVFQCFQMMRVTATLNLLTNLMRVLAVSGMLWKLHHATAWQWAAMSTAVSAVAAAIAVTTVTGSFGRPHFVPRLFLRRGVEGLGYSFASSTVSVYNDVDKTMLSHFGMNAANGIYSMAYRIADMATIPIYSIREAALPRLFQHGRAGIGDASVLSYRLLKRALPLSLLVAVATFLAAPLIPRLIGSGFAESVTALRWLCLIPVFRCVHIMIGNALTGAGLQTYRTIAQVSAASLNLGINLWAIPYFGWLGAAWASLVTDGALCVLTWAILHRVVLRANLCNKGQLA
ncbi:MAG TPA: oligosaccharide flippase family protein [Terracidiphilus sp.]